VWEFESPLPHKRKNKGPAKRDFFVLSEVPEACFKGRSEKQKKALQALFVFSFVALPLQRSAQLISEVPEACFKGRSEKQKKALQALGLNTCPCMPLPRLNTGGKL
jgi:hypothetical protein